MASKLKRSISESLKSRQRRRRPELRSVQRPATGANFADAFWGEAGFEQLRKATRASNELFKEVVTVFEERAELENHYARGLAKLASRLVKATRGAHGVVDSSWKFVADSFDAESSVHNNLGVTLRDEIVQPLRTVYDSQQKHRKEIDSTVDKSLKWLEEKRNEQLKLKKQTHSLAKELEKVERACTDEIRRAVRLKSEKQTAKLQSKRFKLAENSAKLEHDYHKAALTGEYQRSELEITLRNASNQLETVEQQRMTQLQAAMGRYQRRIVLLGPALTQTHNRNLPDLERIGNADVNADLRTMVAECQPKQLAYRTLMLCDFYAEDFSQVLSPDRRRESLERLLVMFQKEIEKERKGKEGLEYLSGVYEQSPNCSAESKISVKERLKDSCTAMNYLDYHLYKLSVGLTSVDKRRVNKPEHPLSKYEERSKDKLGMRQTVLRVPLYAGEDLTAAPYAVGTLPAVTEGRGKADGESPTTSPRPAEEDNYDEPIYERVEHPEDQAQPSDSQMCQAIYDFAPQREDEIELKAGDQIEILEKISEGWWKGLDLRSGETGLLPTNYVEPMG